MTALDTDTAAPAEPAPRQKRPAWRELPFLLALAILLALGIKAFFLQAFSIPSGSMENTLRIGDRVLVNKVVYDVRSIHRGEVVVFNGVDWEPESDLAEPRGPLATALHRVGTFFGVVSDDKDYIKRVIGLPGDRVMCCSADGRVVIQPPDADPVPLDEPYLLQASDGEDPNKWFCAAGNDRDSCPPGAEGVLVPEGRLWVLGDHRGASADSRYHYTDAHQGTIPEDAVVGRAFVVVWPPAHASVLGVPSTFTAALSTTGAPYALGLAGALPLVLLRRHLRGRVGRA